MPSRAGEGEVGDELVSDRRQPHRLQEAHDLQRRGPVAAGQPGAVDGVDGGALAAGEFLDTAAPAAVVPAPPEFGAEQLDQHLGEEVVRVDVGRR